MEESSSGLESEPGAALAAVNNFVAGKEERELGFQLSFSRLNQF